MSTPAFCSSFTTCSASVCVSRTATMEPFFLVTLVPYAFSASVFSLFFSIMFSP